MNNFEATDSDAAVNQQRPESVNAPMQLHSSFASDSQRIEQIDCRYE